ncbi:MAG: hypothetical protein PHP31_03865 [Lentimicrobiaceae bacterium]|nr:hypothetical protein [Lentimicrobiaceae bacterium]
MNKKIFFWTIGLLVILNLSVLFTVIYKKNNAKQEEVSIVLSEGVQNPLNGRYFRQSLNFSDEQMEAFREANYEFQPKARQLICEMDTLKARLFDELNKPKPDSLLTIQITEHIGKHHAELKQITNTFYLKLKAVCTPQQAERLQSTFKVLYYDQTIDCENDRCNDNRRNQGRGYRYQNRINN